MYIFRLFALCSIFLLMSCGGGGGSSGSSGSGSKTSITVSPNSLEFTVNTNSSSTTKPVSVSFKGDGMLVGYPVGSVDPGWLTVDVSESYSSPVTVNIQVHSYGMSAGTHRTTLRFVTGKEDGSNIVYKDVPVTMIVEEGASIATESLAFTSLESVASENKTFNISTKSATDWSLSVQYSGAETNWLTLSQTSGSLSANGSTSVTVSTKGLKQGTHTASLILKNKTGSMIDNVNVSYQVNPGVTFENVITKTITEKANLEDLQWSIPVQSLYDSVKGSTINWSLTSNKDWLKVVSSTGNLASPPTLQLELDADKLMLLENGNQSATLSLSFGNNQIATKEIPVTLGLNLNLQLVISPYPSFTITKDSTESDLQKTFNIGLNAGTAFYKNFNWTTQIGHPLVKAVSSSGNIFNQNTLTLKINKEDLLEQANGFFPTGMTLGSNHSALKPVNIQFGVAIEIPQIDTVSPYVGFTNQSGPLILSGSGFGRYSALQVDFDGQLVDATVINSTAIRVNNPQISSPKTIKLHISNALNIDKNQANFIIKNPVSYTYEKVNVNREFRKIIHDPERQSIILVGQTSNEIGKIVYSGGNWNYSTIPFQDAENAELTVDGKDLLVPFTPLYYEIYTKIFHLDPDNLNIKSSVHINDHYRFNLIAPMYNKKVLVLMSYGPSLALEYPSLNFVNTSVRSLSDIVLSRDRSFVLIGNAGGERGTESFDGHGFTPYEIGVFDKRSTSMSTDANRIVIVNKVYDRNMMLLGNISSEVIPFPFMTATSPDGGYIFIVESIMTPPYYKFKGVNISNNNEYVYDELSLPLEPNHFPYSMTISDDGHALFVLSKNFSSYDQNEPAILNIIPLNN